MAARFDSNNDGVITTQELQQAFQTAEGINSAVLHRADEVFARIHAAITRQATAPTNVFGG
eukprot:8976130-Heterocapsa_arctica.AAC.1